MKTWRYVQLGDKTCSQDQIILNLFQSSEVRYIGHDREFANQLTLNNHADSVVLVINENFWISELVNCVQKNCNDQIKRCYIGINRYCLLGNDTDIDIATHSSMGQTIVKFVSGLLKDRGFDIEQSGYYDQDFGQRFNFVQPLTWIYGTNNRN
jgi:hypothetical protein